MVILKQKQKQKKAVRFDGSARQISSDGRLGRPVKYPFHALNTGDSFFAETYKNNLQKCAANYIKYNNLLAKFDIKDDTHVTRSGGKKKTLHGVLVTRVK